MKKKVLVVDDEQDQIQTVKYALESLTDKYEIIGVQDGWQCLDYLKNEQPDLVLLDMMMPGLNGWQVFDAMQKNDLWRSIPVIFLTGVSDPVMKNTGELLAEDYIEKPFEAQELKKRIDKILHIS
ncbi:MAG: response regulator [Candidatus Thermoplasmatota archaeon]|nr:response regulator [Candidatus Thermoplasmatota archaeon]MBU1940820.1 response regulator [Candidatus Thermoplasmatota archaeon]